MRPPGAILLPGRVLNSPPPELRSRRPPRKRDLTTMPKAYLTKEQAAKTSGRSVRRLLELASAGRIRKRIIRDNKNGNRELAVFDAGDIADLAKGKIHPRGALQISGPVRPDASLQHAEVASVNHLIPRLWLTIAEAADYSGLPASFLSQLVDQKRLPALDVGVRPGGRWRVSKRDIDAITTF